VADPAEYARAKRAEAAAKASTATPLAAAGLSPFALSIAQQRLGIATVGDLARADVQWTEGEKPASVREKKIWIRNVPGFLPDPSRLRKRRKTWRSCPSMRSSDASSRTRRRNLPA
jgi:hypothetical protein